MKFLNVAAHLVSLFFALWLIAVGLLELLA